MELKETREHEKQLDKQVKDLTSDLASSKQKKKLLK